MICCIYLHAVIRDFFSVIPANAGVILIVNSTRVVPKSYPRECGGDPEFLEFLGVTTPVIPANAGVILRRLESAEQVFCYPRECGGDPKL